ncbi:hypothetical protein R5R35_002631 [Gryllus longicercus]|uniref:Dual serine/threonine and tyrosine protein kinase n=1 Tax=Gryllus longicercus TaxID=2509291 RepID=A0AAN9YZ61_9ORTH
MNASLAQEFRKFSRNCHHLKQILRETQHILSEINETNVYCGENFQDQVLNARIVKKLEGILDCDPALIVLGHNFQARSVVINSLLNETLLPSSSECQQWIQISYGLANTITTCDGFAGITDKSVDSLGVTVSEKYFKIPNASEASSEHPTVLEIQLSHPLLRDRVKIITPPDGTSFIPSNFYNILQCELSKLLPILIFAFGEELLTEENIEELRELKERCPDFPVIFIRTLGCWPPKELEKNDKVLMENIQKDVPKYFSGHELFRDTLCDRSSPRKSTDRQLLALFHQLTSLGYLPLHSPKKGSPVTQTHCEEHSCRTDFIESLSKLDYMITFIRRCFQSYLIEAANILSDVISQCLQQFILSAYDMAREIQITPLRIQYAQEKEAELFRNLIMTASQKQQEIRKLIETTVTDMRNDLMEKVHNYSYSGVTVSDTAKVRTREEVRVATSEIHNLVLSELSSAVTSQLVMSVHCFQEIYFGTLQRCLESLERNCQNYDGNFLASVALKQTLSAAYNLKLNATSSSSFLHSFLDRLRKLLHSLQLPWTSPPCLDASWRKHVASEMLDSLNASQLAKTITTQFREKVKASHEAFRLAIVSLEDHYSSYLERTEEQRVAIRKYHAPKLARLALESMSVCDMIRYGLPKLGKELGRGQYGVVFMCESWGGVGPCAVKSVVPPDDKHWNDLAMEFFCTRRIPEHRHIVQIRGSVVDITYGEGVMPSVLLVMDRLSRDLYSGIRSGLTWLERLQIAIDVAEGLRFIHSQGLVHRDIKLKNVLLDSSNRAKITDFGFCIPEAMMSGSIVGTPIHMAPELLSGHYNSSVDVYAFGILFWYLCAGHVKIPYTFERFQNKEQLWTSVRRGIRPERLPSFDDKCWELMELCWATEPFKRPLLGYVLPQLEVIREDYIKLGFK